MKKVLVSNLWSLFSQRALQIFNPKVLKPVDGPKLDNTEQTVLCVCVCVFTRAGALTAGQGNDVVLRTLVCEREKTAVSTHTHSYTQSYETLLHTLPNFTHLSLHLSLCLFIHLSIFMCLPSYFCISFSPCLSCVHNTPLKAGLHVLASDWLRSKKMMSFSVGRCVPSHTHT